MDLLNLCLTSTYFEYNSKHYKQLHEQLWAHQFPLLLQESLCKTSRNEPSQLTNEHYHSGYVTLTIPLQPYTKTKSTNFTSTFNGQNADIQFTKEIEENGKIPFLDCLDTRDNNKLRTTIYRKPSHTDRILDQSSYNRISLQRYDYTDLEKTCANSLCLTRHQVLRQRFQQEQFYFIRHDTHRNSQPNATNTNATPVTTATIPYIKGTVAQILQPYNICDAHKPITTVQQLLTNVKDIDEPSDRQGAVYKIKCCEGHLYW